MSCAACSSRVEKAVSKVPGVTSCSVSLLTNSMGVEGTASSHDIITAVQQAGYGASLKGAAKATGFHCLRPKKHWKTTKHRFSKRRLIASIGFSPRPHVFLHGTHDVGTGRSRHGSTATMLPWGLYSFCLPESSWSSTRNSLSAALRVCGTVLRTWTPW